MTTRAQRSDGAPGEGSERAEAPRAESAPELHAHPARTGLARAIYVGVGSIFVGLAAVGAILPLIPTTPFLLLAGFFYARSSERLLHWLLVSPVFGPYLRQWRDERTVPRRAKIAAIVLVVATFGSSIVFAVEQAWVKGVLALVLVGLVVFLAKLPSPPRPSRQAADSAR